MAVRKGPKIDRYLMRIKDLCLIAGFLWAVFKFIYIRPIEMQAELDKISSIISVHTQELKDVNGKLTQIERTLRIKGGQ